MPASAICRSTSAFRSLDGRFKLGEQRVNGRPASRTTAAFIAGLPARVRAEPPIRREIAPSSRPQNSRALLDGAHR
jgi:hypothetical protein